MRIPVYVEESGTPIYARIAKALGHLLLGLGCDVFVLNPRGFSHESYLACVKGLPSSAVYITNAGRNLIQSRLPDSPIHYFEHFEGRVVFLHQDSILSGSSFDEGYALLQAWKRIAGRSLHLCIEPSSVDALKRAGINNAVLVPHASGTPATDPLLAGFEHQASFVGHVVPSVYRQSSGSAKVDGLLQNLFMARQADLSTPVQPQLAAFADESLSGLSNSTDNDHFRLAYSLWLRRQFKEHSLQFRGWLFEQAQIDRLEIFGGDPGYLNGLDRSLKIERESIQYRSAAYDGEVVNRIFRNSLVSINVTSLQFDYAVINRFHDVFMAGGLCLTDRREGLPALTRHHAEISYSTLNELSDKVNYFSDPSRLRERAELIRSVQLEIVQNSGYPQLGSAVRQFIDATMM